MKQKAVAVLVRGTDKVGVAPQAGTLRVYGDANVALQNGNNVSDMWDVVVVDCKSLAELEDKANAGRRVAEDRAKHDAERDAAINRITALIAKLQQHFVVNKSYVQHVTKLESVLARYLA